MRLPSRLPPPPVGEGAFRSALRSEWLVARVGAMLGTAILVCFLTGLVSHLHQHPVAGLPIPTEPVWGYRLSQGVHVASGLAAIPLLLVKLWSVYPKLFVWPPVTGATSLGRRVSIAVLASATAFELVTGVLNLAQLYLWPFSFPAAHYAVAWIVAGSVLLHLAVTWPAIRRGWRDGESPRPGGGHPRGEAAESAVAGSGSISRRGVVWAAAAAAAAVVVTTAGQSSRLLGRAGVFAPRSPEDVPGGIPVNRTAAGAGVLAAGLDAGYRLSVGGPRARDFTLPDLAALPQVEVDLPIACVEGWSATGRWGGPRLRDVLAACGVDPGATVRVQSLERGGLYAAAEVPPAFAQHPDTLLALRLAGRPLSLDHGYPVRLIAPNRPGVLQTKWVRRVEVV